MLFSALTGETVNLPMDAQRYSDMLAELVKNSRYQKKVVTGSADNSFSQSFI